jgi:hypothetical protein
MVHAEVFGSAIAFKLSTLFSLRRYELAHTRTAKHAQYYQHQTIKKPIRGTTAGAKGCMGFTCRPLLQKDDNMAGLVGFDPASSGQQPIDNNAAPVSVGVWGDSTIGVGVFGTSGVPSTSLEDGTAGRRRTES